jgi:hypothetical protein
MNTNTVTFVHATDLIPDSWNHWFWAQLSESSSITFGDNDYSLINAERFKNEFESIIDFEDELDEDEIQLVRKKIAGLNAQDVYISL